MKDPEFELQPLFRARRSSSPGRTSAADLRRHAAWALEDYGFSVVIAPRSATSFARTPSQTACSVALPAAEIARLREPLATRNELTVDLRASTSHIRTGLCIRSSSTRTFRRRSCTVSTTSRARCQREGEIDAYETSYTPRFDARALPV